MSKRYQQPQTFQRLDTKFYTLHRLEPFSGEKIEIYRDLTVGPTCDYFKTSTFNFNILLFLKLYKQLEAQRFYLCLSYPLL